MLWLNTRQSVVGNWWTYIQTPSMPSAEVRTHNGLQHTTLALPALKASVHTMVMLYITWMTSLTLNSPYTGLLHSAHENHRTCRTCPMARPKCLMINLTNLNRIYKAHQPNVRWTMKVFQLHCIHIWDPHFVIIMLADWLAPVLSKANCRHSAISIFYIFLQFDIQVQKVSLTLLIMACHTPTPTQHLMNEDYTRIMPCYISLTNIECTSSHHDSIMYSVNDITDVHM